MIASFEVAKVRMFRSISLMAVLFALATPLHAQTSTAEAWRKEIAVRLSGGKRFPIAALGQTGTAIVEFVLDRNGKVVSSWLRESSGVPAIDEESLALIKRVQPFPAPPPDLDESGLRLSVPMVYRSFGRHPDGSADIGKMRDILQGEAQVQSKMRSICRGC